LKSCIYITYIGNPLIRIPVGFGENVIHATFSPRPVLPSISSSNINGQSELADGLSQSNVQIPFSTATTSLLWCRVTTGATSSSTVTMGKNSTTANNTFSINANTTGAFSDTTPHNDTI
jgi:hypothetical protein